MVIAAWLFAASAAEAQQAVGEVKVSATVTDDYFMSFTMTWTGKEPLRIYRSDLPWGRIYSTLVVPVTLDNKPMLRGSLPIDDSGVGSTVVQPGVPVQGRFDLLMLYPDLKYVAAKEEVIVFWSYQAKGVDPAPKIARVGGWVKIGPRKK
jgi:hypothetical protein